MASDKRQILVRSLCRTTCNETAGCEVFRSPQNAERTTATPVACSRRRTCMKCLLSASVPYTQQRHSQQQQQSVNGITYGRSFRANFAIHFRTHKACTYPASQKGETQYSCVYIKQLSICKNSFTCGLGSKFVAKSLLIISLHLKSEIVVIRKIREMHSLMKNLNKIKVYIALTES